MMVEPWLLIAGCTMWIAVCVTICRASEKTARQWEKSSNEWREIAVNAVRTAHFYQMLAHSSGLANVEVTVETTSGFAALNATQVSDKVH